jgi:hypothetical protein
MSETGASPRSRTLLYFVKLIRLLLLAAVYALVIWYGVVTTAHLSTPPTLTKIAIAFIALGITGSIYRILIDLANETKGAIMVLAFLNEKLVEPQRRRLRAEGREEGRKEARAEIIADIRSRLLQEGIDPDRIIPPEESDDTDRP